MECFKINNSKKYGNFRLFAICIAFIIVYIFAINERCKRPTDKNLRFLLLLLFRCCCYCCCVTWAYAAIYISCVERYRWMERAVGGDHIFTYLVVVQTFSEYSVSFFFDVNNKCRRSNVKYDLAFVVTYRARVCES